MVLRSENSRAQILYEVVLCSAMLLYGKGQNYQNIITNQKLGLP